MPGIKQVDVLIIVAAQEVTAIVRVYQTCDVGSPDLTAGREGGGEEEEGRGGGGGEGKGVEIWEDRGKEGFQEQKEKSERGRDGRIKDGGGKGKRQVYVAK